MKEPAMKTICAICGHRYGLHYGSTGNNSDCPVVGSNGIPIQRQKDEQLRTYFVAQRKQKKKKSKPAAENKYQRVVVFSRGRAVLVTANPENRDWLLQYRRVDGGLVTYTSLRLSNEAIHATLRAIMDLRETHEIDLCKESNYDMPQATVRA